MKRILLVVLLLVFAIPSISAVPPKPKKPPCAPSLAKCPVTGCGKGIDKNLNRRKNIKTFAKGDTREKLAELGEGQRITVVAYALVARPGSRESCNCGLTGAKNTDNHIVLVDTSIDSPSLENDEEDSVTAEFTPRVRLKHPNFSRAKLQPLIAAAPHQALKVRISGVLMFDSEHSLGRHLTRHNNWELHPVFGLEYCPNSKTCADDSDANWKDLEQ